MFLLMLSIILQPAIYADVLSTIGHSALDSDTPDKFLEIPSHLQSFSEKDSSKQSVGAMSEISTTPPRELIRLPN